MLARLAQHLVGVLGVGYEANAAVAASMRLLLTLMVGVATVAPAFDWPGILSLCHSSNPLLGLCCRGYRHRIYVHSQVVSAWATFIGQRVGDSSRG